jgi:hypothetical protein
LILFSPLEDFIAWSVTLNEEYIFCEIVFIASNAASIQTLYDWATKEYVCTIVLPTHLLGADLAQRGYNLQFVRRSEN